MKEHEELIRQCDYYFSTISDDEECLCEQVLKIVIFPKPKWWMVKRFQKYLRKSETELAEEWKDKWKKS